MKEYYLFYETDSLSVLAVSINIEDLDKLYKEDDRNDIYYITLQLADFIPNSLARRALNKKQKPFSILEGIENKLYDGEVGMSERFGFKIIK